MTDVAPMSPAELAITRQLLGLNRGELARILGVRRDTLRDWETGDGAIPARIAGEMQGLLVEHDQLVARIIQDGRPASIPRTLPPDHPRPASWYHGAAARALDADPDLIIEWL